MRGLISRLSIFTGILIFAGALHAGARAQAALDKPAGAAAAKTAAAPADCTAQTPIALGQTVAGTLASGDCQLADLTYIDYYTFSGTAGQAVYIAQTSSDFDTYLFLYDAAGAVLIDNDDTLGSSNSRIPVNGGVFVLPYTGQYKIGANSYDLDTGAYALTFATFAACNPQPIVPGQTVGGTLDNADCALNVEGEPFLMDRYSFSGTAGQQISIALGSAAFDAYLSLYTPSGAGGVEDNNGGGGTNARIPAGGGTFTLPQTGTYVVQARANVTLQGGAYTLALQGSAPPAAAARAPFDFDGDRKTDVGIFRPNAASGAEWWYERSGSSQTIALQFGAPTDRPMPADYTGDGKADIAFFRPATGEWFVLRSEDSSFLSFPFGANGDVPVIADFDGDGRADPTVFRPSTATWFVSRSTGGTAIQNFGFGTDRPVAADYDGDGRADVAIFRPDAANGAEWWYQKSSNLQTAALQFGAPTDRPVPGDYTGDGKSDIAFFRPSSGEWFILRSEDNSFFSVPFGASGDVPVPGDYDGDGRFDTAVFRPSTNTWFIQRTTAGTAIQNFGSAGDRPIPASFIP